MEWSRLTYSGPYLVPHFMQRIVAMLDRILGRPGGAGQPQSGRTLALHGRLGMLGS